MCDEEAYQHLFLVASGLDSMVVGEPQILGQVKDAYQSACTSRRVGSLLPKGLPPGLSGRKTGAHGDEDRV